jgi:hypothetical protein
MAYAVLPSVRSRTMRATTSSGVDLGLPKDYPLVSAYGQGLPRTASDEVALQLGEDDAGGAQ